MFPKISIITPSFNQAPFLEETILSVLNQDYPNLEYIIVDGGSTDGSVDVIKRYEAYISFWISEKDGGMYDALNKGFERSSGEIMAYINSDDIYTHDIFKKVARIFSDLPKVDWITGKTDYIDARGLATGVAMKKTYSQVLLRNGLYQSPYAYVVNQNAVFWRRSLWDKVGRIKNGLKFAGDFFLWVKFSRHAELCFVDEIFSSFRRHDKQKSLERTSYIKESHSIKKPSVWLLAKMIFGGKSYLGEPLVAPIIKYNGLANGWEISYESSRFSPQKSLYLMKGLAISMIKSVLSLNKSGLHRS